MTSSLSISERKLDQMIPRTMALLWAAIILAAAFVAAAFQVSEGASFGLIAALSGAALGLLHGWGCRGGCRA